MAEDRESQATNKGWLAGLLFVALLVAGVYLLANSEDPGSGDDAVQSSPAEGQTPPVKRQLPPYYENVEDAKPFPETLSASRFAGAPSVEQAYQIAKEIPEVLVQLPCMCGCRVSGHGSLLHCYVDSHAAG